MSSILYYSNFCEHSKKLLQTVSKTSVAKEIHFICIDNRVKDSNNKVFIVLQNGQKIIMPENVTKVPALLLLKQNYKVIYGESIYEYFKPQEKIITKQATQNNLEPMAFSFGGFGGMSTSGGIASDNYSFLDMDSDSLGTKGNGGLRQMHSYVSLNDKYEIPTPVDDHEYNKIKDGEMKIEDLQRQRDQELSNIDYRKV